ncbi:SepM family pheromone-processing serine protease [Sporolactobacillus kofuensis]|uniref:endopeptidase La n=1 Tax=Sporolactobacillus kofuensis TaxID=269672 RepID=A0ABW1WD30_9BACL|nr:SepM family pheromone-processing serine protease [Sporolactobacillus kofuensis]MCO7174604.1 PDZ domain-containing protein [Sporolactobacillus kofuensis]
MQKRKKIIQWVLIILGIVLIALNFYQTPYFVQRPGKAESMHGMIKVKNAYPIDGAYRLVYIYLGQANIYQYLWAKFDGDKYTTLVKENQVKMPNEDEQDYNLRQENYMNSAQQTAAYVAYQAAGKKPKLLEKGVLIIGLMKSMPNAHALKVGDLVIGMDNHRIATTTDMDRLIKKKNVGDTFPLTIVRKNQVKTVTVKVAPFPKAYAGSGRSRGIGIYQDNHVKAEVKPSVKFTIHNIGGPSAGLMMTLDIYDQLTKENLSKGRDIAGTGTIELNGDVGPIGGISDKVVGASKSGADIFFAPYADHEYQLAKKTANEIGTKMKIVPVKRFSDAVNYLMRE